MPCSRHLGRALGQALELELEEPELEPCSRHLGRALGQALELELEEVSDRGHGPCWYCWSQNPCFCPP